MVSHDGKSADAIRIRDNQRRSRANRKEYLKSLEQKLTEYTTRGVQATLEMQSAARGVALENQRLRELLHTLGVSKEDIDLYLRTAKETEPEVYPPGIHTAQPNPAESGRCSNNMVAPPAAPVSESTQGTQSTETNFTPSPHSNIFQEPEISVTLLPEPPRSLDSADNEAALPRTRKRLCTTSTGKDLDSATETYCENAANILSQMRGYEEAETAYAQLGCQGGRPEKCKIKNTVLFQIMDQV